MPLHLSLRDRWRIVSLRLDQGISPTTIAVIVNCSIRTVHNILQLFRETNDVIEREGRGRARASLNNCKRLPKNIKVHGMIEILMLYQMI
ncbi:unnamed protein product [Rotaria sordida]|uniref:Transposase n=1 Tax=Rotaria sordida TaxID=392033 RepID=A0A820EIF5_9BILA|nr:unnamed protein product [Rotaria sordida]